MSKCTICHQRPGTIDGVIKQTYYSTICQQCYNNLLADQAVSSGHAEYNRSRDFETHQADIAQPYDKEGKPSTDFIQLYPDRAKNIFSSKDIRKYG